MREKILSIYMVAIILGILTGILGSLFQLIIKKLDSLMMQGFLWTNVHGWPTGLLSAAISMLMVSLAWLMVQKIAPEASGSGVQEIEGCLLHKRPIFWKRLLPVKFIGGVLAISAKMVLGREGPTIQMGGNLGEMLGEMFHFTRKRRDVLIAAGAGAGLAVAFNAPLAGVIFVIEEMRNQFNFSFINFKIVAICCVMATIVLHLMVGSEAAIPMAMFSLPDLKSLWLFFIFGIIAGLAGTLFNHQLMKGLYRTDKFSPVIQKFFVVTVGLCVGYCSWIYPDIIGGGYEIIEKSLTMNPSFFVLLLLFFARFFIGMVSYRTGVPGGIFAPVLALGTLSGLAVSHIFQWISSDISIHPGMFAVAGMGALFSAIVRAPITGIILIVEMTQNYSLILPLMVTCLTSTAIMQLMKTPPIYTQLLHRSLKNQN